MTTIRPRTTPPAAASSVQPAPLAQSDFKRAVDFVKKNAGGDYLVDDGKLFPAVDSGNDGLVVHALGGDAAKRAVELAAIWSGRPVPSLDPAKQMVVVVRTTDDEARTFVNVVERATGKGALIGYDVNFVDVATELPPAERRRLFPEADDLWGPDEFNASLVKSGTAVQVDGGR